MDREESQSTQPQLRRIVRFSGRVQGVGFRYTTQSIAAGFHVTGFVQNLVDGRVELVAEGSPPELDRFQCAVEQAFTSHIEKAASTDGAATGEFRSFAIRF